MSYILQTNQLTKTIGGRKLVTDVSIHVKAGEIYGFLGPNGAGKTTVMKMILNLWKPTGGSIELFGRPLTPRSCEVLKRIGSTIEFPTFYEHLTGRENLALHCEYRGYYRPGAVEEALELLNLADAADKQVRSYSLGMKQRLGIARAVLSKPELLILDEPTNGLDPAGMRQIRELLKMFSTRYGITIMISSHMLSEIESIADTIGILSRGVLMKEISMREVTEMSLAYIEAKVTNTKRAAYILAEKLGLTNFRIMDQGILRVYEQKASVQEIAKTFALYDVELEAIGEKAESLEDFFLKVTGEVQGVC